MNIHAKGLVRHRFWGEYSASIGLLFDSVEEKDIALSILNQRNDFGDFKNALGGRSVSKGWRDIKDGQGDAKRALFCDVADPVLTEIVEQFTLWGAEKKKILSLAKSIDHGEDFEINIPYEDQAQQQLQLEK